MNNKTYAIINANDVSNVNFDQVLETSADTLTYSIDNNLTFIKWDTTISQTWPDFITNGSVSPVQTCTNKQMRAILQTEAWSADLDLGE